MDPANQTNPTRPAFLRRWTIFVRQRFPPLSHLVMVTPLAVRSSAMGEEGVATLAAAKLLRAGPSCVAGPTT